ncbi:MAG TPA: amidohydrolase family protein [Sumerlaeia bacterium]|nr:amidohydrolase family protein [Sumerlaeia bacterium]
MKPPIERNDLDRKIWDEELDAFVPDRVFDVHTHVYRWEWNADPKKERGPFAETVGRQFPEANWDALDAWDRCLLPGREVHRLAFPFPFPQCDFEASNAFAAKETQGDPLSGALMLVHPSMPAEFIGERVRRDGFLGIKPYRYYAATGDPANCRIADFLPGHQIEAADDLGLIVMLHLSRRDAVADPENIGDLVRLSGKHPAVRWILAHCARGYSAWAVERVAERLRELPNVWFDASSVCESDAFDALISAVGADRVMYGSDDLPVGVLRGKYVAFGRAWSFLSESNQTLDLSHCDPRMTFTRYEQLRAMRRAAQRLGLGKREIKALFFETATDLVGRVRESRPG